MTNLIVVQPFVDFAKSPAPPTSGAPLLPPDSKGGAPIAAWSEALSAGAGEWPGQLMFLAALLLLLLVLLVVTTDLFKGFSLPLTADRREEREDATEKEIDDDKLDTTIDTVASSFTSSISNGSWQAQVAADVSKEADDKSGEDEDLNPGDGFSTETVMKRELDSYDKNGSGYMDKGKLASAVAGAVMKCAFDSCDKDGSGCIDKRNLALVLLRAGHSLSELDVGIKELLDSHDEDGGGTLSYEEFRALMKEAAQE